MPRFWAEPCGQTVETGSTVTFSTVVVDADNNPITTDVTYQWAVCLIRLPEDKSLDELTPPNLGYLPISGATSPTLTIRNVDRDSDEGWYRCIVTGRSSPIHAYAWGGAVLPVGLKVLRATPPVKDKLPRNSNPGR